ncbi:ammonia-dependent NAD(+) synthetase [Marinobacter nanhaiticus D15-8W]|uniref:NH(3)-dependent NAD(+) synthetase n=1 Tax=Marinobacter nanhaiticus D15-8W TaxID=626887 RepID=N6WV86_9GAMM|nr:ammonia-dependent NAD(+) synthetase [Marinobacter nanhaiticus]ENO14952.1 ammonia-dependent NAD(+) synthetase [Marinobacter nanhaiticus D15-8W]BES69352.1 ammonia-dependent NAD(+) synthetase [Marinobacter nanhaiticus D15-8W]
MENRSNTEIQKHIISQLNVHPSVDPDEEVGRRVKFLCEYMEKSGQRTLVLGISGGVDSTVAGRLAQLAVERTRDQGGDARFVAMRLPYGEQKDEADARRALDYIAPDETLTVGIKGASDAMLASLEESGLEFGDEEHRDFVLGNIKARQRMVAQYAVAGARGGLVIGTDQGAEAVMGFFTKFGDGACDLTPLDGLNKRQVREIGRAIEAPSELIEKQPTADLESLSPQKTDESVFGISYDEIDDFLEGREVGETAYRTIFEAYFKTEHKRTLPLVPQ